MVTGTLDGRVLRDVSWWHWVGTLPLLGLDVIGEAWAGWAAIGLCVVVGVYFYVRVGAVRPLPVQVRVAYLGLLVLGMLPWMGWLHWVQLVGTTLMVVAGYCPLLRALGLLPWNRGEALTRVVVWRAVTGPCGGGLVKWSDGEVGAACSLVGRG